MLHMCMYLCMYVFTIFENTGGAGDLIPFLAAFSKDYGASVALGQDFLCAITDANLQKNDLCPMVRVACLAANLTTNKTQDGVARLITRADLGKIKSKKMQSQVAQAEELLMDLWKAYTSSVAVKYRCFGKAAIRTALLLTGKWQQGRENKQYHNLREISEAFRLEVMHGPSVEASLPEAATDTESFSTKLVQLEEAKDPRFLACSKIDVKVGNHYIHKGHPGKIWTLIALKPGALELQNVDMLSRQKCTISVQDSEIIDCLKMANCKPPTMLDMKDAAKLMPVVVMEEENEKCTIFKMLFDLQKSIQTKSLPNLLYQEVPTKNVWAGMDFKKNELVLVPVTDKVANISLKPLGKVHAVATLNEKASYYVHPPKMFKYNDEKDEYTGMIAPFWQVASTKPKKSDDGSNMAESFMCYKNLKVTVILNPVDILKHDCLCLEGKSDEPEVEEGERKRKGGSKPVSAEKKSKAKK